MIERGEISRIVLPAGAGVLAMSAAVALAALLAMLG
jgi:pantoate kinase